jgi:hypothetical protein
VKKPEISLSRVIVPVSLCKKIAGVFQRVGGLILATEQSNPSPVLPGHVSDRRYHDRYQHLNTLLFETISQAIYLIRARPQT